jgi:DNA-binding transcriptional MerR regulator
MGQQVPIRRSPQPTATSSEIPDKLYFRIGEVARLCEVPAYVLRFWESEFPQLKPNKGGTGQRLYRRRDVEMALRVKRLLYDEGYTIPGARQLLKSEVKSKSTETQLPLIAAGAPLDPRKLQGLRRELESILALLSRPADSLRPSKPVHTLRAPKRPAAPLGPPSLLRQRVPRDPIPTPAALFDHVPAEGS